MKNNKKLYIDIHKEDDNGIRFENLGYFYDIKNNICIQKKYIECDLEVGLVYDFTYEDDLDTDTYSYIVLKKDENIYYIAEYYDRFCECGEGRLGDCWTKCDVKEELGIDIEDWKIKRIYSGDKILGKPDTNNEILDKLVDEMKSRYFHMVGTQFDNAILEMEKIAEKLKK